MVAYESEEHTQRQVGVARSETTGDFANLDAFMHPALNIQNAPELFLGVPIYLFF